MRPVMAQVNAERSKVLLFRASDLILCASWEEGFRVTEPLGRSRALLGLTEAVARHGVDPAAILTKAGINFNPADDPERWVPFRGILACYELAAREANLPSFGMELARSRDFAFFGPLNLILKYSPDFHTALLEIKRFLSVHVAGAYETDFVDTDGSFIYQFFLKEALRPISNQWVEESLLTTLKVARIFIGNSFTPASVCFKHSPISPIRKYAEYFGIVPEFDTEIDGIEFPDEVLQAKNRNEDHDVLALITSVLGEQTGWDKKSLPDNVRSLIRRFLPTGQFSIEIVADQICSNKRTLQRRLSREGLTYDKLLEDTRKMMATELLEDGNLQLSTIAYHLGYREQSTFNHAFKRWYGVTPGEWRKSSRHEVLH